jgi:hypothetical protein
MSRIPAAVLAALSFLALGMAIVRASCASAAPCTSWIAADAAARSHGILGFEVVAEGPRALDVRIDPLDGPAARLRMGAGASSTEQTITGFGAPFVVRTRRDQLALGRPGAERIVARRDRAGDAWSGGALDAGDAEALARVLALDVALAVQGTSLVFGGAVYASCTARCSRAERCVRPGRSAAACADDVVVCAACLERAP